jgi:hypothetical protein
MSRKNSSDTAAAASAGGGGADADDELSAEERAATEADVQEMLAAVQAELQQSGAQHAEGHADAAAEEEDKVAIEDHFSMTGLTLSERDDASNSNSQSNSVHASPAIAPSGAQTLATAASAASGSPSTGQSTSSAAAAVAQATALSDLPPVELKDGGNAAMPASDMHVGSKQNFFDVRVAVVGNVDSGESRRLDGAECCVIAHRLER